MTQRRNDKAGESGQSAEGEPAKPRWKERRMVGGRWQHPDDIKRPPPRADKTVSVRLTEKELAAFDAQVAAHGLKRNRALRIAARRIAGFLEADTAVVAELRDATRQIGGIARNVNQIARAANRTHEPEYRAFMEERQKLGREIARLDAKVQEVLDVAERRKDGDARLDAARSES